MSQTVQGSLQMGGVNLTTSFTSGTAGVATEVNSFSGVTMPIGPGEAAGRIFSDFWSQTYSAVAAPFTIDLTALPGIGGRTVTLSALRYFRVVNSDPTAGHNINAAPGASNGLAALWTGTTPSTDVLGGMPGATIDANGKPIGNETLRTICTPTGIVVDSTHKTITFTPTGTVSSFTVFLGG